MMTMEANYVANWQANQAKVIENFNGWVLR